MVRNAEDFHMDEIRIDNLKVYAYHGVYDSEKEKGQNFYVNAVLHTDFSKAAENDDIELATDYAAVCQTIKEVMTVKKYDLIETVAERVAEQILISFERINAVDVEIRKPQAPVPMEFESISVKVSRKWSDAYIAYGSNMGDKEGYIEEALNKISGRADCKMVANSSLINTKPYGGVEQDDFLNGVCHIKTLLKPEDLLDALHEIENEAGRERKIHWGPRTLDLDILFYDNLIYDSERLAIPHADIANRDFVLVPMAEIAPYKRHPISGMTMEQMLQQLRLNVTCDR